MFTGIIEELGLLNRKYSNSGKKYFSILCNKMQNDLKIGDSIACNGICLTVVSYDQNTIVVEVMEETWSKTTAKLWRINSKINLERAMLAGSRFDGHVVQGHVDCVVKLQNKYEKSSTLYLDFNLPEHYSNLVVPQGSIAINGTSLTVAHILSNSFSVALIGLTKAETNLAEVNIGELVNIEFDIIGKYIIRQLNINFSPQKKITQEWLLEKGF